MKEMRLFEVGLKERQGKSGYDEKVNVAANDAEESIAKARQWVVDNIYSWWNENDGRKDMIFSVYSDDDTVSEGEMTDSEILASEKYQAEAEKVFDEELARAKNMLLAKVLDIGTLIV